MTLSQLQSELCERSRRFPALDYTTAARGVGVPFLREWRMESQGEEDEINEWRRACDKEMGR